MPLKTPHKKVTRKTRRKQRLASEVDLHLLYEEAVQDVHTEIDLIKRVFKRKRGRAPRSLCEDFCGTAKLACEWAASHKDNTAFGVDLDEYTLEWAHQNNMVDAEDPANRVTLVCDDVLVAKRPPADVLAALNFSYCIFKTRDLLLRYFKTTWKSLGKDGLFLVDLFGGTGAVAHYRDVRDVPAARGPRGRRIPRFTYVWDQADYNPVTNEILCRIHFRFADQGRLDRAFTYDWRLWTLPELQELMSEAGFSSSEVYLHGFDEDGDSDDVYRVRKQYENAIGWVAYVVGWK